MIEEDDSEAINDKIVKQKSEQVSLLKEHKIPEERQEVCIIQGQNSNLPFLLDNTYIPIKFYGT